MLSSSSYGRQPQITEASHLVVVLARSPSTPAIWIG
jgi:hypothetical protein